MEIRSNEEKPLAVTVREMSRCAAALIDEVQASGRRIVISRYGRPAAVLTPLDDEDLAAEFRRWHAEPRYISDVELRHEEADDPIDMSGLSAEQIGYFQAIGDADPDKWEPRSREELLTCATPILELELRGLIDSHSFRFWLTDRGRRAFELLRGAER